MSSGLVDPEWAINRGHLAYAAVELAAGAALGARGEVVRLVRESAHLPLLDRAAETLSQGMSPGLDRAWRPRNR
jgi:hypothetical protein